MATNETATGQGGHTGDASQAVFVGADIFDRPLSAVRGTSGSVIVMRPADDDPDNEADAVVSFSGDTAARLAEWIRPGMADPADTIRELREKYHELLYAVGNAYPGETRHQTALRYIVEREARTNQIGDAKQDTAARRAAERAARGAAK